EFSANEHVIVNPLRVNMCTLHELNYKLLLYYTGVSRSSASIIDAQIAGITAKSENTIQAMHHVKEQAVLMKDALLTGRLDDIGRILDDAWQYKKKTSNGIS